MDIAPSEPTRNPSEAIKQKITESGLVSFRPNLENNEYSVPDITTLKTDMEAKLGPEDFNHASEPINNLYKFLSTPIVDYVTHQTEGGYIEDINVDKVDTQVVDLFQDEQERAVAYDLIQKNRMRVNPLSYVVTSGNLLGIVLSGQNEKLDTNLGRINTSLLPMLEYNEKGEIKTNYKKMSKDEKENLVRQYSLAASLMLRAVDGQEIPQEDWDKLEQKKELR